MPEVLYRWSKVRSLAHLLYRSLQGLLALPAHTLVLPGHVGELVAVGRIQKDHSPIACCVLREEERAVCH